MLEKRVLTILELNWNQRLEQREDKIEHLSSYAHVVYTTVKQVISRRRKNENFCEMSKDEICTCKACKNTVFHCQICKFVGFLLPSSSWLLKLPNTRSTRRHQHTYFQLQANVLSFSYSLLRPIRIWNLILNSIVGHIKLLSAIRHACHYIVKGAESPSLTVNAGRSLQVVGKAIFGEY